MRWVSSQLSYVTSPEPRSRASQRSENGARISARTAAPGAVLRRAKQGRRTRQTAAARRPCSRSPSSGVYERVGELCGRHQRPAGRADGNLHRVPVVRRKRDARSSSPAMPL